MNERKKPRWKVLLWLYLDDVLAVGGSGCLTAAAGLAFAGRRPWPCWERRCWAGPWRPPREGDDKMLLRNAMGPPRAAAEYRTVSREEANRSFRDLFLVRQETMTPAWAGRSA